MDDENKLASVALPFCHFRVTTPLTASSNKSYNTISRNMSPETVALGKRLRQRRLELHIHDLELARRFKIGRSTLRNWGLGLFSPEQGNLGKIQEFLEGNPDADLRKIPPTSSEG